MAEIPSCREPDPPPLPLAPPPQALSRAVAPVAPAAPRSKVRRVIGRTGMDTSWFLAFLMVLGLPALLAG
ncbi:hypothetical protein GCM10010307_28270 [Streptomyces vastus]|uniref:Uncharacterized protein n=1 Tax=Streptomyces vastus TaxID=285451 RepID=A0ABP6D4R0_9ACTN